MKRDLAIVLLLAGLTLLVYAPVLHHPFISYDDPDYVTSNSMVKAGLTAEGAGWAFTTWLTGNWHPLTWISHMLDVSWFGLEAGGHHGTSLVLHALNAALLFVFLRRASGAWAPSALVAGIFALHPLHVESVAWIAERKDVLAATFGLLALLAWTSHVSGVRDAGDETSLFRKSGPANRGRGAHRRTRTETSRPAPDGAWNAFSAAPDGGRNASFPAPAAGARLGPAYIGAVVFFALGLLAKPMLVSLPLLLVLLDVWPFRRIGPAVPAKTSAPAPLGGLLIEKAPFFALAAASCVVTFLAQRSGGAVSSLARWPLGIRIENALVSYVRYLIKMIWPANLAIFYPMPRAIPAAAALGAGALLIGLSALAVLAAAKRPYVAVGWFWFVGMLLPVIGLVKIGGQSMADRYTYLPLVGIAVIAAWGLHEALGPGRRSDAVLAGIAALACLFCAAGARAQLAYWKDSVTLYTHAIDVTTDNALAQYNLGCVEVDEGREESGAAHFTEAIRIDPDDASARANLGASLLRRNRLDDALRELAEAVRIAPLDAIAQTNLGTVLMHQGRLDEALAHQREAVRLVPGFAAAHVNLGVVYGRLGRGGDAVREYTEAVRLDPGSAGAQSGLGSLLANLGRAPEALPHLEAAVRLLPGSAGAHANLGNALLMMGRAADAAAQYREALRIAPGDAAVERNLQRALSEAP